MGSSTHRNWKKQGKKNKIAGARFEKKVREHFEGEGWVIDKWSNNIDIETKEIIPARNFYIPGRGYTLGAGFPDFVLLREKEISGVGSLFQVIFIECKINGKVSLEEKKKLNILQKKGNAVYIAYEDCEIPDGFRLREFEFDEKRDKIPRGALADIIEL